ncbi:flagellar hook-basal body complex protein FliE [Chromobacterium violaceum]|uniref:Flagellar hook-basal body complex protein FliE n=3 Tax=Chromobacterium violaceum TaxID=536 RepID=A0A1R0MIP3_CHRVL|nr:flagellar hook-basal body complex protein FliE [Chromobacterium violaceum]AAQ60804.1 flagellar hook-basal body complex protein [Chromobacterium violaceum ATCC 12472]ATP29482.1 flagellar hook-basal body complex protein FliE [Chromobacterium violaceum]ATP33387.1 flagellar hook-basal body complex protein FliE [Chromobacterium violaceum]KJH68862.1 flagellar hook-basal body protein FliE [Chromobacterium violaceum]KMN47652.1 flagellar hook-basal body protein FliE [Chromobacterium violaceum]
MSVNNIDQLLGELKSAAALASGKQAPAAQQTPQVDFSDVLKSTIEQVNSAQQTSEEMQKQFQLGDNKEVNLQDVMMSLQKASLSFQTMVQARNKLVSAYQEIMNTQV